jgi:hypothetical protein
MKSLSYSAPRPRQSLPKKKPNSKRWSAPSRPTRAVFREAQSGVRGRPGTSGSAARLPTARD